MQSSHIGTADLVRVDTGFLKKRLRSVGLQPGLVKKLAKFTCTEDEKSRTLRALAVQSREFRLAIRKFRLQQ